MVKTKSKEVQTMNPAKNLMRTIQKKEMRRAAKMARQIIHQVVLKSLKTLSPKFRTERNAPSRVMAAVSLASLTAPPSTVSFSDKTVLLGLLFWPDLTTLGRHLPTAFVLGKIQGGQFCLFKRSFTDFRFHSQSVIFSQKGLMYFLISTSLFPDVYAAYMLYFSFGHLAMQICLVGQPWVMAAGFRHLVRSKKSKTGRFLNS